MVVKESYNKVTSPPVAVVTSKLASEKYVVVKNHVRELKDNDQVSKEENLDEIDQSKCSKQIAEKKRNLKHKLSNCTEIKKQNSKVCKISTNDLEELKTVYYKCKRVIENIETKYGHLLNLTNEDADNSFSEEIQNEVECMCDQNKKIVFDEEGQQIVKETDKDNHICLKKLHCKQSKLLPEHRGILIEHEHDSLQLEQQELPDSLTELGNMLKDSRIKPKHRRNIINKIKLIKLDYMNEIRCNKEIIVKQLKTNPEEILTFEGTNLGTLTGYPI